MKERQKKKWILIQLIETTDKPKVDKVESEFEMRCMHSFNL